MEPGLSVAFRISWIGRMLRTRFDARARTLGLTRSQWSMIASVSVKEGATQSEIASQLEINTVTAGRIIDRLEAAGWMERRPDPVDRRANRLYLTPTAAPMLASLTDLAIDEEQLALAGMTPAEREILAGLLERMVANLTAAPLPLAEHGSDDTLVLEADFG